MNNGRSRGAGFPSRPPAGSMVPRAPAPPATVKGGIDNALVSNAETARALVAGAPPRAIIQAFTKHPFKVGARLELDPTRPLERDEQGSLVLKDGAGGVISPAAAEELRKKGATVKGVAVVNRVSPEQLLAIVVSLIATSRNASEACVRIRQEVTGWRFESTSGEVT